MWTDDHRQLELDTNSGCKRGSGEADFRKQVGDLASDRIYESSVNRKWVWGVEEMGKVLEVGFFAYPNHSSD